MRSKFVAGTVAGENETSYGCLECCKLQPSVVRLRKHASVSEEQGGFVFQPPSAFPANSWNMKRSCL